VTGPADGHRRARAALTYLAEPADPLLGGLLRVLDPAAVLASIRSGTVPARAFAELDQPQASRLRLALARWQTQLPAVPADGGLAAAERDGIRLVCPGDPEWPPGLDDLGAARPCALWVRGTSDLRACCQKSLAIVGARAASAYGTHAATQIAADLAGQGWAIISGAAYGIDAAAHGGALAVSGITIAVLACGPDIAYPREHRGLLTDIAIHGALISEYPPGRRPDRMRFLARNRLIAALALGGTIVIEAAERSGTMTTARCASDLHRPLMAVPGPVTSAMSAGCHALIREQRAVLVTSGADVLMASFVMKPTCRAPLGEVAVPGHRVTMAPSEIMVRRSEDEA
jgi:DNA processing protein